MGIVSEKGLEKYYYRKRIIRIIALCSALICAVLFSLALSLEFDPEKCLFERGSVLAPVSVATATILTVIPIILTFSLIPKEKKLGSDSRILPERSEYFRYYRLDNSFLKVLRLCTATVFVFQGIFRIYLYASGRGEFYIFPALTVIMLLLGLVFAFYFLPEITDKSDKSEGIIHLICGVIGAVSFILNIINLYFCKTYSLASEYMHIKQVILVLFTLALIYEIRFRLDGGAVRARLATACASFVLGFGFSFAQIVMLTTAGPVSADDTSMAVCSLFLSLYFGARLLFYSED